MGFFNNTNTEIKEFQPGEVVNVGEAGKFVITSTEKRNYRAIDTSPKYHFECQVPELSSDSKDTFSDLTFNDLYKVVESKVTTWQFDIVTEQTTRYYKVTPILEKYGEKYKLPSTMLKRACYDCVFYGKCSKSPYCNTRNIKDLTLHSPDDLIDRYFFEKGNTVIETLSTETLEEKVDNYHKENYGSTYYW